MNSQDPDPVVRRNPPTERAVIESLGSAQIDSKGR